MEERFEDDDAEILSSLSSVPPHRKTYISYSQQLGSGAERGSSGAGGGGRGRHKRNTFRNQSLEEERMPQIVDRYYDSSDEETFPHSSSTTTTTTTTTSTISNNYNFNHNNSNNSNSISIIDDTEVYSGDFLQRNPSSNSDEQRKILPEFIGSGGGKGIFKVPNRGAVHPGRPPNLELRPHPLRESQVGCFLRTIASSEDQLWAGEESGLRFWNFSDAYAPGSGLAERGTRGDEEASPFYESVDTSPTLCMIIDSGNKVIWSGHKDGKIRSWKMDQSLEEGASFKEGLAWNAHRGPILSMVMTSYGDLWSGSENGIIKIWPWEAMEKSLNLTAEERHMASLLVERSYIDLKNQVNVNGVSSISSVDVKYLLSDNFRSKVWSAGCNCFAMWDARTRDLVKVFNIDGQIENRIEVQDTSPEDEMKAKLVSSSKKEKSQSFFQRSRNALMGAADAVRRVATKGGFTDDNRRIEALALTIDGMIWSGCSNGLLVQWDGNGNRLQDFQHHSSAIQCLCTHGLRIWVGYVNGLIQVLDLEGSLRGQWVAHSSPVISMAVGAGYVFTLANHGGIRGWCITSPSPLDNILRSELASKEHLFKKLENLKILTGTWNVGQGRASHDSLIAWLGSAASEVGIVVVGLQEVEMGAGFLAMSAAKETVGLEGSSIGQWWLDTIGRSLDEGITFDRLGSRQLAGLLIAVWVRKNLRPHVGDVEAAAVPCGFGRAIGNKGAVGLRMRVYGRAICFVNCHFAAHLDAVNRRNADFDYVYRTMTFNRPSNLPNIAAAGVSAAVQTTRGANHSGTQTEDAKPELSEVDMVVFLGDFNYRLHGISYDEARDFVSQRCFDWLRERDQLRAEMKAGKVFQGMREAIIKFPPTYKFERHQPGLAGYDSGEKKRIPAWCDRILYRDTRSASVSECTMECPVVTSVIHYEACMEATESDHKPVRCIMSVDIAHADESMRRQEFGKIMEFNGKIRSMIREICYVPETIISTNNVLLQDQDTSILRITNKSEKDEAIFGIICEGQSTIKEDGQASGHRPRGSFGFPRWLEVTPAAGIIKPGHIAEVAVHHEDFHTLSEFVDGVPQNWWCEDARDKEVILVVNVHGSCSTKTASHRISVRHNSSSKMIRFDSKSNDSKHNDSKKSDSKKKGENVLQRSDFRPFSSPSDVSNELSSLKNP